MLRRGTRLRNRPVELPYNARAEEEAEAIEAYDAEVADVRRELALRRGVSRSTVEHMLYLGMFYDKIYDGEYHGYPIHYAAYYGDLPLVESLVRGIEDLWLVDSEGYTPLEVAVRSDQPAVVNYIIKKLREDKSPEMRAYIRGILQAAKPNNASHVGRMLRGETEKRAFNARKEFAAMFSKGRSATAKRRYENRVMANSMSRLFENKKGGRRTRRRTRRISN